MSGERCSAIWTRGEERLRITVDGPHLAHACLLKDGHDGFHRCECGVGMVYAKETSW